MLLSSTVSLWCVRGQPETTKETKSIPIPPRPPPASSSSNVFMKYAAAMGELFTDSIAYFADNLSHAATSVRTILTMNSKPNTLIPIYDYIVTGGGAAGAPAARTLADGIDGDRKSVLLIERGSARSKEQTPNAMDIYGAGIAIGDSEIAQLLITSQGVRSHIGSVMGGGTSINMAIVIEESEGFFDYLNTFEGVYWDKNLVKESYEWVSSRVAAPMPISEGYGEAWIQGLANQGYIPNNGYKDGSPALKPSTRIVEGHTWQGASLFNSSDNFYRNAADNLIGGSKAMPEDPLMPETLSILTKHTVLRVEFDVAFEELPDRNGLGILLENAPPPSPSESPRGNCVVYRPTTPADTATINSRETSLFGPPVVDWIGWLDTVLDPLGKLQKLYRRFQPGLVSDEKRACVREGGEIVLSAGAVLTPVILFKSGVGPKNQIEELRLPLVKEIPSLGQSISDRVLIPIGMFRKAEAPVSGFPTRICQGIGAKLVGPDCNGFNIGDRNLKCTLTTAEELGGNHIGEHVIYSTRFIFPPEYRNHPLIEYLFNIVTACADGKYPFNNVLLAPACVLAKPIIDCFRRVVANFYFTAEPKSRGYIHMNFNGDIQVNANYMKDEQDLFDAVRGVSNLIKIANSDVYRGILQESSESSCPVTVLNSLLDLILHMNSDARPVVPEYQANNLFQIIQNHLKGLIPIPGNVPPTDKVNEEETIKEGIDRREYADNGLKCQPIHYSNHTETCDDDTDVFHFVYSKMVETHKKDSMNYNAQANENIQGRQFPFNLVEAYTPAADVASSTKSSSVAENWNEGEAEVIEGEAHTTRKEGGDTREDGEEKIMGNLSRREILNILRGYARRYNERNSIKIRSGSEADHSNDEDTEHKTKSVNDIQDRYNIDYIDNRKMSSTYGIRNEEWAIPRSPSQWVASYPPTLPDPDNPADVAKYVLTYMTSIWHWTGSARMGDVVDNNFNVKGLNGISIIDASVMSQVTRMNPTATLMMLGRYAGIKKLRQAKGNSNSSSVYHKTK